MRIAVLAGLLVACELPRSPPTPPREPPPPPRSAATGGPAAPEGPRAPELREGDPVARCVARNREALTPELRRALDALQDDVLLADSCRMELAVRGGAPEACAAVVLPALRVECGFRAAVTAGRPEGCPSAPGSVGRDPTCVALAARDSSLCAAARIVERQRCLALAYGSPAPCATLAPELRPSCERGIDAIRGTPAATHSPPRHVVESRNGWSGVDAGVPLEPVEWLLRGVFLDDAGAIELVDARSGWSSDRDVEAGVGWLAVRALPVAGVAHAAAARLRTVRGDVVDTADGTLVAEVRLTVVPRRRGDRVAGSVRFGSHALGDLGTRELRFDTFVRDVVPEALLR